MNHEAKQSQPQLHIMLLLIAVGLLASYVLLRFGGRWGEADTSTFVPVIDSMLTEGRGLSSGQVYQNGYGFPFLVTTLIQLTGLTIAQIQLFGAALLAVWIVLPAWLAYRALTGSEWGATLATVIVLIQPEFMFLLLRGTHEKFTRGLMFLGFYLIVRTLQSRKQSRLVVAFILSFYLVIYAMIAFNNLMAFSYILVLGLSLLISFCVSRFTTLQNIDVVQAHRRLAYMLLISVVLVAAYTFYAYEPARINILIIESVWERLSLLLFNYERAARSPYDVVGSAWISSAVYFTISISNWLLLIVSFVIWLMQSLSWLVRGVQPKGVTALFLWSLYGASGFVGAVTIAIDISGAIAANLQHRFFPSFSMVAAAVVAAWLLERRVNAVAHKPGRLSSAFSVFIVSFLCVAAVLKATNEPLVSNKWLHYAPAEKVALHWFDAADGEQKVWVGFDERMFAAMRICCSNAIQVRAFDQADLDAGTRNLLVTSMNTARARRLGQPVPTEGDSLRIYDNGSAEIHRLRPRSPFQK